MDTPIGLEILKVFNKVRIILYSILILNAIIVLVNHIDNRFFLGLAGLIIKPIGLDYPFLNISTTILTMIGFYWIPILSVYLENVFIENKTAIGFYIVVVIDILFTATYRLSILSVLILLLIVPTSSRTYFKKGKITDNDAIQNNKQDND